MRLVCILLGFMIRNYRPVSSNRRIPTLQWCHRMCLLPSRNIRVGSRINVSAGAAQLRGEQRGAAGVKHMTGSP